MKAEAKPIARLLLLSTGRCDSTMLSDLPNLHPDMLGVSEAFSLLGPQGLFRKRLSGRAMRALCSRRNPALRAVLSADTIPSEMLYPVDDSHARCAARNVPPILCAGPPHLAPDLESLYRRPGTHRAGASPGGSLMSLPRLRRLSPAASVVHVYRDGRDTALSMSRPPGPAPAAPRPRHPRRADAQDSPAAPAAATGRRPPEVIDHLLAMHPALV